MIERLEFGKAFANRIWQLILEIAYDLPHPDVRCEEFYFSDNHVPIPNMEVGNVIHQTFRDQEQVRWKYITENCIRKAVETVFTHISNILFYVSKHYGEVPYQLINWFYDTRYAALVASCETQIFNFFKKEFPR